MEVTNRVGKPRRRNPRTLHHCEAGRRGRLARECEQGSRAHKDSGEGGSRGVGVVCPESHMKKLLKTQQLGWLLPTHVPMMWPESSPRTSTRPISVLWVKHLFRKKRIKR